MAITGGAGGSVTSMSDIMKTNTDRVGSAIADVGKAFNDVVKYGDTLLKDIENQSEEYTEKHDEIITAFGSSDNLDSAEGTPLGDKSFNNIVNDILNLKDSDDEQPLDTDTTNALKTLILLQMTTDQDGDGDIDKADTDALFGTGDTLKITDDQMKKFQDLLTQTLLAHPNKATLEGYITNILDDDESTDATVPSTEK